MNWPKDLSLTSVENLSSLRIWSRNCLCIKKKKKTKNETKALAINPFMSLIIASHNFMPTGSLDFRCCHNAVSREGLNLRRIFLISNGF